MKISFKDIQIAIYPKSIGREEILADFSQNFSSKYYSNISYSKNYLAIAGSERSDVGVDLEAVTDIDNFSDVAKDFFHKSEFFLLKIIPQKRTIFTKLWAIKEAWCKLNKVGINEGLPALNLSFYMLMWIFYNPKQQSLKLKSQGKYYDLFCREIILDGQIFYLSVIS